MKGPYTFECKECNKIHEGSPSFSFPSPAHFNGKMNVFHKLFNTDFWHINNDYFIRTVLEIPIIGSDEPFTWGVWVSQSKENYLFYKKHFRKDLTGRDTFGWFSSILPYYKNTEGLKTQVLFQQSHNRPKLHLHDCDHELSQDFHKGITIDKAMHIAHITENHQQGRSN